MKLSSIVTKYVAFLIIARMAMDFTSWPEYKDKVIDAEGNMLGNRKISIDPLMNLVRKTKLIIKKYAGIGGKMAAVLIGAAMLREEMMKCTTYGEISGYIGNDDVKHYLIERMSELYGVELSEKQLTPQTLPSDTYLISNDFYDESIQVIQLEVQASSDEHGVFCCEEIFGGHVYFLKGDAKPARL